MLGVQVNFLLQLSRSRVGPTLWSLPKNSLRVSPTWQNNRKHESRPREETVRCGLRPDMRELRTEEKRVPLSGDIQVQANDNAADNRRPTHYRYQWLCSPCKDPWPPHTGSFIIYLHTEGVLVPSGKCRDVGAGTTCYCMDCCLSFNTLYKKLNWIE